MPDGASDGIDGITAASQLVRTTGAAPTPLRAGKPIVAVDSERAAGQYVELAIDAYLARQRGQASGRRMSAARQ
jgi:hypothetical protein